MKYVAQPPPEPGYYWLKHGDVEEIVEVWNDPNGPADRLWIHRCGDGKGCEMVTIRDGQWAGPIPKPTGN